MDPAAEVIAELDRALRGVPDPPPWLALSTQIADMQARLERIDSLLDEFLPMIRAYLDPNQSGPRGAFMRRRLAKIEGQGDG